MQPNSSSIIPRLNWLEKILPACIWVYRFAGFSLRQFMQQNGLQIACSLAYTTLLSLVPLVTVMFGSLGGLQVFQELSIDIQLFIFNNFVPSFGDTIQNYLLEFSGKASQLTFTGVVALFFIALMLLATIENALNRIWRVKTKRNPVARFLVYWAILTLGPLFIGIGMVSTSYLLSLPALDGIYATFDLKHKLLQLMPLLTTAIAFTIIYILIPNCHVPKKYAILSGALAGFVFECAKFGFGIYIKTIPTYEAIYGAIAIIPMFLLWIYLSWVIILLGAHLCYCLSNFQSTRHNILSAQNTWSFIDAYKIIAAFWQAQRYGHGLRVVDIHRQSVDLSLDSISEIVFLLNKANWLSLSATGVYLLSRDLADTTVKQLYELLPCKFCTTNELDDSNAVEQSIADLQQAYRQNTDDILNVPLRDLLIALDHQTSDS